jgi:hypothetical protein
LLIAVVVTLLAFAVPLTVAGVARVARDVGAWRADAGVEWRRTTGRVVAVRDDTSLTVRIRYRDESGTSRLVRVALDGRSGRWLGPSLRLRYDAHDHSNVDLAVDGTDRPGVGILLAGAPLGAGLAALLIALALWRRRDALVASERPIIAGCSASVAGAVVLAMGLTSWAVGTVVERGWSGVLASISDAVDTAFAELLGILIPLATFVIGGVLAAWLVHHRSRLDDEGVLAEAYGLLHRAAEIAPSPDELLAEDASEDAPERTEAGAARVDASSPPS